MFLLVLGVQFSVVGFSVCEHLKQNFQQTLSQTSQRAGVAHTLSSFLFIIGLSPNTGLAKTVGPKMNGMSQKFIARPAHSGFANLSGLEADRRGSGKTLENAGIAITGRIAAHRR